jgi:putative flippase GtrA
MIKNNLTFDWWKEIMYLVRHAGSGVVNTIVGFIVIFFAMSLGFSPIISNVAGYGVGFILGFVISKKFVFRSNGHFVTESIRYLIAFALSFAFNLLVLHFALAYSIHAMLSQVIAAVAYTLLMYTLMRLFVFNSRGIDFHRCSNYLIGFLNMNLTFFHIWIKNNLKIVFLFLGLTILANVFATYYMIQEHYIYFWDNSGYWLTYTNISKNFLENPLDALFWLYYSIQYSDYNHLPVLPLVPVAWMFGTGRIAYILGITNVFLLPSVFVIGLLSQRIFLSQFHKVHILPLGLATISTLMFHKMWTPVFRGYPDIVGLLVLSIVLLLYFSKPLAEQKLLNLIAIGLLLCLVVLLRRWYVFWVVAFFPALAVSCSIDIYQRHGFSWSHYMAAIRNAVIIGLTFVIALYTIAEPFMLKAINTDYSDIYSAYQFSRGSLFAPVWYLVKFFGWGVIICGLAGLIWLAVRKNTRTIGIFLIAQLFITFVIFLRTQDFGVHHYYLLAIEIVLGISTLVTGLWIQITNKWWRITSVGTVLSVLLISSAVTFSPIYANVSNILGSFVPQEPYYPLVRNDLDLLSGLLDRLGELELEQQGGIYVLASSKILNHDILENACKFDIKQRSFCNHILHTHNVDKIDGLPYPFFDATYLIVASPTQYHLRPEDQRVIGLPADEVMEDYGVGTSFQRLQGEFKLDDPDTNLKVTVWIFKKIRPFKEADLNIFLNEFGKYYPQMHNVMVLQNIVLGDKYGNLDRIGSQEWAIHPGDLTDTVFDIVCKENCSGNYWAHMSDSVKNAPPEGANVKIKILDSDGKILIKKVINRQETLEKTFLSTNSNKLKVYVNNNGSPDSDHLTFGMDTFQFQPATP